MEVSEFFDLFFEKELTIDYAVDTAFFKRTYGFNHNISAYYLKKATYNKKIICVKVKNKTYYMHRNNFERFKKFERLNYVKVIYGT